MLLGQYLLSLEKDQSLVVPTPLQVLFAEGAYITHGFERNLLIMSDQFFREKSLQIMALNLADPEVRLLFRMFFGYASKLSIGKTGHILIPLDLMAFAELKEEAILIGQGEYLEVWSPEQWERQSIMLLDTEANAERFARIDLT